MINDTISAISTAFGKGAISIIRLSGDDAISITSKFFKGKNLATVKSHTITYGHIMDGENQIDEVLVSVFKKPNTFTKEDVVEINCHGGIYVANKILELTLKNGARAAEGGEFTKRAYLNGRIDLTQAESIMDIIEAKSDLSLSLANKGLDGDIYKLVVNLREDLLNIIANIEVNIDYPEYDDVEMLSNDVIKPKVISLIEKIKRIIHKSNYGKIIREGIDTAIIGRPNVGKSSLLNALLREDKAIVTDVKGTTRDTVEGSINLGGIILNLMDTAGIRESNDLVEKIGIDKSKEAIKNADLILFVVNNNEELSEEDELLLDLTNDKNRIVIVNKIDLATKLKTTFKNEIRVSALNKSGILDLEGKIKELFLEGNIEEKDQTYVSNARHIARLHDTLISLTDSLQAIKDEMPIDMAEIDLKSAWYSLGEIIGETKTSSLLDEMFSKFCLGK